MVIYISHVLYAYYVSNRLFFLMVLISIKYIVNSIAMSFFFLSCHGDKICTTGVKYTSY